MANISRNTFEKLKHYVSVRLQQGVPLLDADWNELEDIRRFELQAFLKWFVGNGVPAGNDGFRIQLAIENNVLVPDDFFIQAGRCFVDGWDIINDGLVERNADGKWTSKNLYGMKYSEQRPVQQSDSLWQHWHMDPIQEFKWPTSDSDIPRVDLVYLDSWEREINEFDDPELINEAIGIPTCTRIKREWVVRVVQEFEGDWEKHLQVLRDEHKYHVYYGLAQIKWDYTYLASNERVVSPTITDLRRTELRVPSTLDIKQITTDAYGDTYDLDGDGQPNLKVSLREAINTMLKGGLPSTPDCQLTGGPEDFDSGLTSIRDKAGNILIFWNRLIIDRERQIWYKKYQSQINHWEDEEQLTLGDEEGNFNDSPFTVVDRQGTIWLFWHSYRADTKVIEIRYKCCQPDKELGRYVWSKSSVVTSVLTNPLCSSALVDSQGNIWIFGIRDRGQPQDILGMMYESGKWVDKSPTINEQGPWINFPIAVADNIGVIWLFWMQEYLSHSFIRSQCYTLVKQTWESEVVVTAADAGEHRNISVLCDKDDTLWVFWSPSRDDGFSKYRGNIWYKIREPNATDWSVEQRLTADTALDWVRCAFQDRSGDVWVFWERVTSSEQHIWYKRYNHDVKWSREVRLTVEPNDSQQVSALQDSTGDLHVYWNKKAPGQASTIRNEIWYNRLLPSL